MRTTGKHSLRKPSDKEVRWCGKCGKQIEFNYWKSWYGDWYTLDDRGAPWCLGDSDDHLPIYFKDYAEAILHL